MPDDVKKIDISTSTIIRSVVIVLLVALFFVTWKIFASIFLAMIIAASLEPTLKWLEKRGVRRVVSVPVIYILAIGMVVGIFYAILPSLFNDIFLISQDFPQRYHDFTQEFLDGEVFTGIEFLGPGVENIFDNLEETLIGLIPDFIGFIVAVSGGVLSFLLILVFSFYFCLRNSEMERSVIAITKPEYKDYVGDLFRRIQRRVGKWLQAQFVLAATMGMATFIVLHLLGVRFALTLGIIAGFLEFIPFLGPITAGILIFAIASLESFGMGLIAVGAFTLLQQIQLIFVNPNLVGKVTRISPLVVLVAATIGFELAGMWGILIAIPLSAVIKEIARDMKNNNSS